MHYPLNAHPAHFAHITHPTHITPKTHDKSRIWL